MDYISRSETKSVVALKNIMIRIWRELGILLSFGTSKTEIIYINMKFIIWPHSTKFIVKVLKKNDRKLWKMWGFRTVFSLINSCYRVCKRDPINVASWWSEHDWSITMPRIVPIAVLWVALRCLALFQYRCNLEVDVTRHVYDASILYQNLVGEPVRSSFYCRVLRYFAALVIFIDYIVGYFDRNYNLNKCPFTTLANSFRKQNINNKRHSINRRHT